MKRTNITHEFVEYIPAELAEGVVYISVRYRTAVHKCACGCGNKVVTPIRPADWQLVFDGDSVSLTPSIGNWQFPCRSHYVISRNEIVWASPWTKKQIEAGRIRDQRELARYFAERAVPRRLSPGPHDDRKPEMVARQGIWRCLRRKLSR